MTTVVTTTPVEHSSDATFRVWAAEVIAQLLAVGITQTADTGQINTGTATRPGTNTNGGYAIFRFNDSMQGTAPIFFRIDFGTGVVATGPRMQLTVGTGSNGSGTITGIGRTVIIIGNVNAPASTVTNYGFRICYVDGFLGFMWKLGATVGTTTALGFFAICRSVDSAGAATAEAATIYVGNSNPSVQQVQYTLGTSVAMSAGSSSLICGGFTTSLVGGAAQVFRHYHAMPKVVPNKYLMTVLSAEIGNNTTFTAQPITTTSHTYISGGANGVQTVGLPAAAGQVIAMMWE